MAIDKNKRIGMYPNQDYKTKVIKPGMKSVKLTEANIIEIQKLKVGDKISLFENSYLKDSPQSPHMFLVLPSGDFKKPAGDDDSF